MAAIGVLVAVCIEGKIGGDVRSRQRWQPAKQGSMYACLRGDCL